MMVNAMTRQSVLFPKAAHAVVCTHPIFFTHPSVSGHMEYSHLLWNAVLQGWQGHCPLELSETVIIRRRPVQNWTHQCSVMEKGMG